MAVDLRGLSSWFVGLIQADFLAYLEAHTDTPANIGGLEIQSTSRRPFLRRTMMQVAAPSEEDKEMTAMAGTSMRNGLECKLTTLSSKVQLAPFQVLRKMNFQFFTNYP